MKAYPDIAERVETLKQVPFFSRLDDRALQALARAAVIKQYPKGGLVFLEGSPCSGLFVVHSGAVKVFKVSAGGREQVLTIEQSGRPVAELPVLDEGPYPASAMAMEDSTLLLIPKEQFHSICRQQPEIAFGIIRSLAARFRKLVGLIEALAFLEVGQRLARFLLEKAKREGRASGRGLEFKLEATHQELAAQIGTVRELVSRNLSRFQDQGIISIRNRTITVLDLERLEAEAEGE